MFCLLIPSRPGHLALLTSLFFASFIASSSLLAAASSDEAARRIVEKADEIRFPKYGFQVDVKITTLAEGRDPKVRKYRIISKGNDKTLVMTMAPAVDRGQIMLMRDRDLWVFMPNVSRPIRLPLSQKLTGQVANGDLARANFSGDYNAKLLRTEKVNGQPYYLLELTAARRGVTYHRVLYWVAQHDYRPYKAEFYSVSKRLLKSAHYQDFKKMGGAIRPTRLVIYNSLRKGERSLMDYANMKVRKFSDKIFTKQYLKKLQ